MSDTNETVLEKMDTVSTEFDHRTLRQALGRFATGVCVITTANEAGQPVGLTVNSFSSVSLDPPLILWSLAKSSANRAVFEAAPTFAVNILSADQQPIALRFAKPADDRFAGIDWWWGRADVPVLTGASASLQCATAQTIDGGDHVIFLGQVLTIKDSAAAPLVFHEGRFKKLV